MHPYHRSPWVDVAAVVFVLVLLLAPVGYLALAMMGGSGGVGGGGGVVSGGGPAAVPSGARSSFSAWTQRPRRTIRPRAETDPGRRSAVGARRGATAPFSAEWRAQATPSLTTPSLTPPGRRGSVSGGAFGEASGDRPSGIASSGGAMGYDTGASVGSSRRPGWVGAAREFGQSALALSRQLEQMDRDPVQRSLGPEAAPSEAPDRASGSTSAATTNSGNPPLPAEPVPVGDHLYGLLVAGLLWGAWRLHRG